MKTILPKSFLASVLLCQALVGVAAFADNASDAEKAKTAQRMAVHQAVEQKTGNAGMYEKNLVEHDPMLRELSIEGLESIGAADAADQVGLLLIKDPDPAVREEAARALKAWNKPSSLPTLIKGSKDPIASVRVLCLEGLGQSPDPAAHKAILADAKDTAPEVRRTVMSLFAHASTPDVVPAVTAALSDPDPFVRANAAQAISFYAKLHMPAELKTLLNDPDPAVQASAARSLLQAGDSTGVKTALEVSKNENQTARLIAIDALGYTQAPEAKAALAQIVANDPDAYAREGAQLSLKRIGLKRK